MNADVQALINVLQPLRQQGLSPLQAARIALTGPGARELGAATPGGGAAPSCDLMAQALALVFEPLTPAELAVILRALYPNLSAVEIGRSILDPAVFPDTSPAVMQNALITAGFAPDVVADAVNVLYPITVTVQSTLPWQDTGLNVTGRQITQLSASGSWTANPSTGMVGPAGNSSLVARVGYALPGAFEGALIGRIGSNPPFLVSNNAQAPAGQSGSLQLCINDDLGGIYGAGLRDNIGSVQVSIVTR